MIRSSGKDRWKIGICGIVCCLAVIVYIGTASLRAEEASGIVIVDAAKVRSSPGAGGKAIAVVKKEEKLYIIGGANDTNDRLWYQISVEINGKSMSGFVRSDLIEVTGTVQIGEEPPEEMPENNDMAEEGSSQISRVISN